MDLQVEGNAALVTASSSGLGYASAEALAREGADVAICGRDADRLDDAAADLRAVADGDVLAVQTDITERDEVEALVAETADTFGGIDHLVTSAGGPRSGPFLDMDDDDWYGAYDLLVMSVVWATRAAHDHLAAGEAGSIVNVTSRSVAEVIDGLVLSNSVRRAVIGLMKTQAREFAPDIRVNAVLPGSHETSRIEELIEQGVERGEFDDYEEGREAWGSDVPLGRIGDPAAFGDAVAWLASPRASYLTGTAVPIDGGSMRS
jgi:NAD(P)-dependent dehydrogenase (short-subunit alcohol dehydrogenase family)